MKLLTASISSLCFKASLISLNWNCNMLWACFSLSNSYEWWKIHEMESIKNSIPWKTGGNKPSNQENAHCHAIPQCAPNHSPTRVQFYCCLICPFPKEMIHYSKHRSDRHRLASFTNWAARCQWIAVTPNSYWLHRWVDGNLTPTSYVRTVQKNSLGIKDLKNPKQTKSQTQIKTKQMKRQPVKQPKLNKPTTKSSRNCMLCSTL